MCLRRAHFEGSHFVAKERCRGEAEALLPAPAAHRIDAAVADPTVHPTFGTPASQPFYGTPIWTDLSYTELDAALPPSQRRVVVTVMKTIEDARGEFLGVLRVGLLEKQVDDEVAQIKVNPDPDDPYRIFLCDDDGRLVTRLSPDDRLQLSGDDLRVVPARDLPEIAGALVHPALREAAKLGAESHGALRVGGRSYVVSFRPLEHAQGWNVGIVGPEDYYLKSLREVIRTLLLVTLAVIALVLAGGILTLRAVRRGLADVEHEAVQMRAFHFAPSRVESPFRDVNDLLQNVERAKTSLRALGKYVPVGLVRELFEANREPMLGGRMLDVSLMFTDIKDFTTLAETLPPDRLARLLGHYLGTMTAAIQSVEGTVDKYVGDAIMAIWNAPHPVRDHARKACEAALACVDATRTLFASHVWEGMPPLMTRFGLHHDAVMVGHFGAPDRMSFTAIGDGVNLASRLEGLNKVYGTAILASEAIYEEARSAFVFRHVDRVAVKGRSKGVEVYELIGRIGAPDRDARIANARTYERALSAYLARDFGGALTLLEAQLDDPPSGVLAERCRRLLERPPPADWNGTHAATTK
jgi:adenylate cyclase